jgi:hypothetical protein
MATISKLEDLLKNIKPELDGGKHYLSSVDESQLMSLANYLGHIRCIYREEEGLSVLFSEEIKEEMSGFSENQAGPFALITLRVKSDLMAVGFLAKITGALAKEGISVNAISAYHHDHLLVPYERKEDAMKVLRSLQIERFHPSETGG